MNKRQAKKKREKLLAPMFKQINRMMKPHRPTERRQLGYFKITRQRAFRLAFFHAMVEAKIFSIIRPEEAVENPFYVKGSDIT